MGVLRHLQRIEETISNACLAGLVAILALQVFFRYVLDIGLSWSEEVSRFLFVWFVYLSASFAVQRGTHIRLTIATALLPRPLARFARLLADLIWIAFNVLVVVSGAMLIRGMIEHPVYSTSLFVPMSAVYVVIPVAHALMIIRIVLAWRRIDGDAQAARTHAG